MNQDIHLAEELTRLDNRVTAIGYKAALEELCVTHGVPIGAGHILYHNNFTAFNDDQRRPMSQYYLTRPSVRELIVGALYFTKRDILEGKQPSEISGANRN